jgi:hypothetical protein
MRTLILFALFIVNISYCNTQENQSKAFISLVLGKVSILKSNEDRWLPAKINQVVNNKDKIRCEKRSRCEIKLSAKKILRIGELTSVTLNEQSRNTEVEISNGNIWLNIILEGEKLKLKTPTSVASIRGTIYRANADSNSTQIKVYEGSVGVSPFDESGKNESDSSFLVIPGQEFIVTKDVALFIAQEKIAAKAYMDDDKTGFEEFIKQDSDSFNSYRETQKKDFEEFESVQLLKRQFQAEEDLKDEWVQWNKELDRLLGR